MKIEASEFSILDLLKNTSLNNSFPDSINKSYEEQEPLDNNTFEDWQSGSEVGNGTIWEQHEPAMTTNDIFYDYIHRFVLFCIHIAINLLAVLIMFSLHQYNEERPIQRQNLIDNLILKNLMPSLLIETLIHGVLHALRILFGPLNEITFYPYQAVFYWNLILTQFYIFEWNILKLLMKMFIIRIGQINEDFFLVYLFIVNAGFAALIMFMIYFYAGIQVRFII